MSHGGGGEEDVGEANLTSLLDLVLQLLMFFLIVANFVVEQNNQDIRLPIATTASPIDKEVKDTLSCNVDQYGNLVVSESESYNNDLQIQAYMLREYNNHRQVHPETMKFMAVVVRGDNRTDCQYIHRVMTAAKQAGFSNVQLRANKTATGS